MNKVNLVNLNNLIVLLYKRDYDKYVEATNQIRAMYKCYYYNNFVGFNIYFKNSTSKYFYEKSNCMFLSKICEVDIANKEVLVDGKEEEDIIRVDKYEKDYYKLYKKDYFIVTNKLSLISMDYKNILSYYEKLAEYSKLNFSKDEPLYILGRNYEKLNKNFDNILFNFVQNRIKSKSLENEIILPFSYNQSQYKAIEVALKNNISVIEGPPGTGKTQTILNLVTNLVYNNLNCAVISNNNTAINNVYEKLAEDGYDFFCARLGGYNNVEAFFDNLQNENYEKFISKVILFDPNIIKKLYSFKKELNLILKSEVKLNELSNILIDLSRELSDFDKHFDKSFILKKDLTTVMCLKLINRFESSKKFGFLEFIYYKLKYKINIKNIDINKLINYLEYMIYSKRIMDIKKEIDDIKSYLASVNKKLLEDDIKKASKTLFEKTLQDNLKLIKNIELNTKNYKQKYSDFIKRFPVVLSTSYSLINNVPIGFMFDYIIIDEASQGDLLSSVLALSLAKNAVIVGDSRQLEQIDEVRLFNVSSKLVEEYNIPSSYAYHNNSILGSVKESMTKVPTTLLKEHYRCSPDIIGFCNKMFYNNELIPMTNNNGVHIEVIKTVPGNHTRINPNGSGYYNQREIDEIVSLLKDKEISDIGVITPFKYQANLIEKLFEERGLEASTIHKFQGRQKDEIILSFVVNSLESKDKKSKLLNDFITNEKLLNVAISRAKNKVTIIVSDQIYNSSNNIINDFIKYAENIYSSNITKESKIVSVFDYLYSVNNQKLKEKFNSNEEGYKSELLMCEVIDKSLAGFFYLGYAMHVRLSKIINNIDGLDSEEQRYIMHPWTHVDFMFYNKLSKEVLFVIEVDGIKFHEQNKKQKAHDDIKDKALALNGVPIYRFKTNESNEVNRFESIIEKYKY